MDTNNNLRKRIAHIGRKQGEVKLQHDDVVYDIMKAMDAMNTSESNLISYQQFHESRSKKKKAQLTSNAVQYGSVSTNTDQSQSSKQMKKVFRGKAFPLMAKCQRSWKFLKKNRCIPKPRAHVGTIVKPPQKPLLNTNQSHAAFEHSIFTESVMNRKAYNKVEKRSVKRQKEEFVKTKKSSKKAKSSHSVCSFKNKEPDECQFTLDFGSDTDSEYEKFVQKHHLKMEKRAKHKLTISSESEACSSFEKRSKIRKKKQKRLKQFENNSYASVSKITSKKLSDTEDSSETPVGKSNLSKSSPSDSKHSKKFQESTKADTSDEEVWNEPVYDFDEPARYDSSDASEDKQSDVTSLLIDKNVSVEHLNMNDVSEETNAHLFETNLSQSNPVSELNVKYSEFENIKARCNVPCYVMIKRDPIIEKKIVSFNHNHVSTNKLTIETHFVDDDDDDCIIVNESTELDSQNPNEIMQLNKSTSNLSSKLVSTELNSISEILQTETCRTGSLPSDKVSSMIHEQNVHEMLALSPVNQTEKKTSSRNEFQSIDPVTELLERSKSKFTFPINIGETKQVSENICSINDYNLSSVLEPQTSSSEIKNMDEIEECIIICEKTAYSHNEEISSKNKETHQVPEKLANKSNEVSHEIKLENCKTALSEDCAEKSLFNVQILSVKSLDQSESTEIIDITDDTEETFSEAIHQNDTSAKDTNETVTSNVNKTDDSDIEIIFSDSSSSNYKSNLKNASVSAETSDPEVKADLKETRNGNTNSSLNHSIVLDQDDCIILDETDFQSKSTTRSVESNNLLPCNTEANLTKQLKCDGKGFSDQLEETSKTSDNLNVSYNDSASKILKILDTIDFDTINRVVKATTPVADASIFQNIDNNLGENGMPFVNTSCEEDLMVSQNYTSNSENQLLLNKRNTDTSYHLPDQIDSKINLEKSAALSKKNKTSSSARCLLTILNDNFLKPVSEVSCTGQDILQSSTVSSTAKDLISNNESFSKGNASEVYNCESNQIQTEVDIIDISGSLDSCSFNVDNLPGNSSPKVSLSENVSSSTSNKACISLLNEPVVFNKPSYIINSDKKNSEFYKPVTSQPHSTSLYKEDLRISNHLTTFTTKQQLQENFKLQNEKGLKLRSSEESPSDELDIIATKSIQSLDDLNKTTVGPLLELYKAEYKKYMEIKCTEKNVSAGLKLLQENQAKKLMHISLSIKNLVQHDSCLYKVANKYESCKYECKSDIGDNRLKTENSNLFNNSSESSSTVTCTSSNSANIQVQNYDCASNVKIFNPSVVQSAAELVGSKSSASLNNKEVYNHLINSVCAECGKHALAACLSCAKVYYCSEECGKAHWSKGHFATCRR